MNCKVQLQNLGKRYQYEWIFKGITQQFEQGQAYAILGPNGSGKSTLMQLIAASLMPSEGRVQYQIDNVIPDNDQIYQYISWAAPYIQLIEDFTLLECIRFQAQFKPFVQNISPKEVIAISELEAATHKAVRYFSSGMRQRLKVTLAVLANAPVLLLDEPTMNLDRAGIKWYQQLLEQYALPNKLLIIASNQAHEYQCCTHQLNISQFKVRD